jgi:hypothetical protein
MMRRDLTPAQLAKLVSKRKAAYEATHPETKYGATGRGGKKDAKFASFTKETAARTGKSVRAVALDVTRGKALGADLDRIAGTEPTCSSPSA